MAKKFGREATGPKLFSHSVGIGASCPDIWVDDGGIFAALYRKNSDII